MNDYYSISDLNNLSEEDSIRIKKLRIPPNWTSVKISKDASSKIQVIGEDNKKRLQYIYHPAWVLFSKDTKYSKIKNIDFNKLNRILKKYSKFKGFYSKFYVISNMLLIMKDLNIRVGNEKYLEENDSVGLCTLDKSHYKKINENGIINHKFLFKGKRGIYHEKILNKNHIKFIENIISLPGKYLFKYNVDNNSCNDKKFLKKITADDLNNFLKENVDFDMTCKDIRTNCANNIFKTEYSRLIKLGYNEKKAKIDSIKLVSLELGNTPKVCRDSYIDPNLYNN